MFLPRTGSVALSTFAHLMQNTSTVTISNGSRCVIFVAKQCQQSKLPQIRLLSTANSKYVNGHSFISRKHVATTTTNTVDATLATPSFENVETVSRPAKPPVLPSNIVFRYCPTVLDGAAYQSSRRQTVTFDVTHDTLAGTTAARPLMLLFAWMLSKESHIEKYREFWFERGYDVLSVRTPPLALLLPGIGGKKIAEIVYNFLSTMQPRYDEILIHAFSVGGYQLCELLYLMTEAARNGDQEADKLYKRFKGFIVDSCVYAEDCPPGLSRAMTTNPVVQPIVESLIANFLKLTKPMTMDRYMKVSSYIFSNERRVPGLLLFSKTDLVSSVDRNFEVVENWKKNGTFARSKCWDNSPHVLHYKEYPQEYENEIDSFVSNLNITKAKKDN